MKIVIISTSYDRKSLKVINSKIVGYTEVEGYEYFQPLVEEFYNKMKETFIKDIDTGPNHRGKEWEDGRVGENL